MVAGNFTSGTHHSRQNTAVVLAFLSAPVLPAFISALNSPGLVTPSDLGGVLLLFLLFYLWSGAFAAILAVPAFFIFSRIGQVGLCSSLLVGTLVGAVAAAVIPLGMPWTIYHPAVLGALPLFAGNGALGGGVFYAVLRISSRLLRPSPAHPARGL